MNASPSAGIDLPGTSRSFRHASTAARTESEPFDACPAAFRRSATRRRFSEGLEGSGGAPVIVFTQRSYGTSGPLPRISIPRSHMTSLHRPRPSRYAPRIPPSACDPEITRAIAPFTSTVATYASIEALSGVFAPTPPFARSFAAVGCVYAAGSGSSENQQSAMKRPVPDGPLHRGLLVLG